MTAEDVEVGSTDTGSAVSHAIETLAEPLVVQLVGDDGATANCQLQLVSGSKESMHQLFLFLEAGKESEGE